MEYVGEWKDGKSNGFGVYAISDGSKYVGEWENDNPHGQGIRFRSNGDITAGEWVLVDNTMTLDIEKTKDEVITYLKEKYPDSELLKNYYE